MLGVLTNIAGAGTPSLYEDGQEKSHRAVYDYMSLWNTVMHGKIFILIILCIILLMCGCAKLYYKYFCVQNDSKHQMDRYGYFNAGDLKLLFFISAVDHSQSQPKPVYDSVYLISIYAQPIDTTMEGLAYFRDSLELGNIKFVQVNTKIIIGTCTIKSKSVEKWGSVVRKNYIYTSIEIPDSLVNTIIAVEIETLLPDSTRETKEYDFELIKKEGSDKVLPGWINGP